MMSRSPHHSSASGSRSPSPPAAAQYSKVPTTEDMVAEEKMRARIVKKGYESMVDSDEEQDSYNMENTCCGSKRTTCLTIAIIILTVVIIGLAIALGMVTHKSVTHHDEHHKNDVPTTAICYSDDCISLAGDIMDKMNRSVDPCQDFYNYACGGFVENVFLPPADGSVDVPLLLAQETARTLFQDLICRTDECLEASGAIISQMNMSVDPCVNFYEYACGGFVEREFMRPAQSHTNQFSLMQTSNFEVLYQELEKEKTTVFGVESNAAVKAKKLMKLCMNVTKLQRDGHAPLQKLLSKLGSWSINEPFNATSFNFSDRLLTLNKNGFSPLFDASMSIDDKNNSIYMLTLSQYGLTLSSETAYGTQHPNETQHKKVAFINYGIEVARLMGTNETVSRPAIEGIYELERRMAEIYVPKEFIRNAELSYNKFTVADGQKLFAPFLDLKLHLNEFMDVSYFQDDTDMITSTKSYFTNLTALITEYLGDDAKKRYRYILTPTPLIRCSILNDYMTWHVIDNTIQDLGADFQFAALILSAATAGKSSIDERWKICTDKVDQLMPRTTGALFIDGRFSSQDRDMVTDMVSRVRDKFIDNFPDYTWMDEKTADLAAEKAKAIRTRVGYPDYIKNITGVDNYYSGFTIGETLFESIQSYRLLMIRKNVEKIGTVPDDSIWGMSTPTVNAYYSPIHNMVVLPSGILRKPFYNTKFPLAWNYGGMGAVVGHELSHAFDDQGSQYDKDGNLVNWLSNKTKSEFDKLKQCFVDQYSNYTIQGLHLNGNLSLGENIADNGGVALSYHAYLQKLEDTKQKSQLLPSLNLTSDQLFFLSFAQVWCSKSKPEYDISGINTNPHSPNKFRVQGAYSNSQEFSDAFQCKEGAPYNPKDKCKIW